MVQSKPKAPGPKSLKIPVLDLLTIPQAAEVMHGSEDFIRELIRQGKLRYVQVGNRQCVRESTLIQWVEDNEQYTS